MARFHELVAAFAEDPAEVVIATETDRGLFVGALVAAGYTVLAVNPMSTSRYRAVKPKCRRAYATTCRSPAAVLTPGAHVTGEEPGWRTGQR